MEIVKTEVTGICRETTSGGLINVNYDALEAYKKKKSLNKTIAEMKSQQNTNEQRLQSIENDVSEIKQMLLQLLSNKE